LTFAPSFLLAQFRNTRQSLKLIFITRNDKRVENTHLSFKQFQTGTATGADMAQFVFGTVLGDDSRGITSTNDYNSTLLGSFDAGVKQRLGASSEVGELENTRRTTKLKFRLANDVRKYSPIPEDRFCFQHG